MNAGIFCRPSSWHVYSAKEKTSSQYMKNYVWDLNARHLGQTYTLKILAVEQQLLYTIHLPPLPLTRALEGFFLSVET